MAIRYRRFDANDRLPVYRMFRDSIWDFMLESGIVSADDSNDIDAMMARQFDLYLHLEATAAEDWVAEDDAIGVVGWARSILRGGHLQLTHFFVDTRSQGQGVGSELLKRSFAPDDAQPRSIIATTNPRALSLYLRQGVSFQSLGFCFDGKPRYRDLDGDIELRRIDAGSEAVADLYAIDAEVVGYERRLDLDYFLEHQPGFLLYRDGRAVAYAFGCDGKSSGPGAALAPADLPAVLQVIANSAADAGLDSLPLTVPGVAAAGVDWAIANGYRMDAFFEEADDVRTPQAADS